MPRLFLGNLGYDCSTRDIEKIFKGYGEIRNVNIKGKFGFLEIEDKEDAEDAIRDLDGKSFNGGRIRIEYSNAYTGDDRRGRSRDRSRDREGRFSDGRFRKTNYRIVIDNLSGRTSWQNGNLTSANPFLAFFPLPLALLGNKTPPTLWSALVVWSPLLLRLGLTRVTPSSPQLGSRHIPCCV